MFSVKQLDGLLPHSDLSFSCLTTSRLRKGLRETIAWTLASTNALSCLQFAAECFLVDLVSDMNKLARHGKRATVMVQDLDVLCVLSRKEDSVLQSYNDKKQKAPVKSSGEVAESQVAPDVGSRREAGPVFGFQQHIYMDARRQPALKEKRKKRSVFG